jgi:ATP-dependent helicase STH1/SNF2
VSNATIEEGILQKAMSKKQLDNKIIQAGMFSDKGSDQERNLKLRDLISNDITKEAIEGDEEDREDIYNDQEINEVLCRGEKEYDLF